MFSSKKLDRIEALQERIHALQDKMHERLRDIDIALIVREPGTARAAEAYEGLRKSVATAARERRQHLAQLVEFVDAIERGATVETLRQRCEQWCIEAGLERRSDVMPEWFAVVEGEGPVLEVVAPAWVDSASGQLVKQGTARRLPGEIATTAEVAAAEGDTAETPAPDGDGGGGEAQEGEAPDESTGRPDAGATPDDAPTAKGETGEGD